MSGQVGPFFTQNTAAMFVTPHCCSAETRKPGHWFLFLFYYTLQRSCKKHSTNPGWPLTTRSFKIDALTRKQVLQTGSSKVPQQVTQRPGNLEDAPGSSPRQVSQSPVVRSSLTLWQLHKKDNTIVFCSFVCVFFFVSRDLCARFACWTLVGVWRQRSCPENVGRCHMCLRPLRAQRAHFLWSAVFGLS